MKKNDTFLMTQINQLNYEKIYNIRTLHDFSDIGGIIVFNPE